MAKLSEEARDKMFLQQEAATFETQSFKKMWAYVRYIVDSDSFQSKVKGLREWYQIPSKGFETDEDIGIWRKKWGDKLERKLDDEVEKLCFKYHLYLIDWDTTIKYYIHTGKLELLNSHIGSQGLCDFETVALETQEGLADGRIKYQYDWEKSYNQTHPLGILFSNYATKRDLIDYVEKMWPYIHYFQEHWKEPNLKVGKIRAKKDPKIQARNKFIYEHRHLPLKKIRQMLREQHHIIVDDGLVSSIKYQEKRRRKEV